jgi:hypothetical protein
MVFIKNKSFTNNKIMNYYEYFADYLDNSNSFVEYFDEQRPDKIDGCTLITSGPAYDRFCQNHVSIWPNSSCLLYQCPESINDTNAWRQHSEQLLKHFDTNVHCPYPPAHISPVGPQFEGKFHLRGFCPPKEINDPNVS